MDVLKLIGIEYTFYISLCIAIPIVSYNSVIYNAISLFVISSYYSDIWASFEKISFISLQILSSFWLWSWICKLSFLGLKLLFVSYVFDVLIDLDLLGDNVV